VAARALALRTAATSLVRPRGLRACTRYSSRASAERTRRHDELPPEIAQDVRRRRPRARARFSDTDARAARSASTYRRTSTEGTTIATGTMERQQGLRVIVETLDEFDEAATDERYLVMKELIRGRAALSHAAPWRAQSPTALRIIGCVTASTTG